MRNKLLMAIGLVASVVILNFFLIRLAPGDPALTLAGQSGGASEETLASIRQIYGLDKPLWQQFFIYIGKMLTGDLGKSYYFNLPVIDIILERVFPTLLLVLASLFISVGLGTMLGALAARQAAWSIWLFCHHILADRLFHPYILARPDAADRSRMVLAYFSSRRHVVHWR